MNSEKGQKTKSFEWIPLSNSNKWFFSVRCFLYNEKNEEKYYSVDTVT